MQDLALILRAANEDFEGATRMKRDEVGSQDSSFRNSLDSAGYITPKPSIFPAMDNRETYSSNKHMSNSVYYDNIHNLSTGSAFLMDRAESEAGGPVHKKSSSTMHIGPHLGKDRGDLDPKLKALGSEISKRISEIRRHDETGPDVVAMENELAYDETLQQKTTCQHCLMIRRRVIVPKHKEGGNVDFLYCDKHVPPGGKGLSKAKTPNTAIGGRSPFKGNKPETNIERSKTPPKKVILEPKGDTGKGSEEVKKLLEMTEKDLYEANEELKRMGFENRTLQEELENVENAKDEYARQLAIANTAYKESVKIIESLLEQIKRHLGNDLKFYDKVYNKAVESKNDGKWMEVVKEISPLKAEAEDILRKIRERAWETIAVKESEEFLQQLDEARKLRRIVLELKMEDNMNKEINKKLERYIKDLEEQMDNLKNDPKNANKNNIMKVLQLTKELKESGIRETELNREVEGLKANLFDLKEEYDAVKANSNRSSKPKYAASEDVEEAIRQLALIILSKDAEGISEQTRAVLKDVFPATMQKSILQWEQRVRELEEQNKRLLDDYTAEVQRGAYVTSTAIEMCLRLVELLSIFESNKSANLPPGLKKFREDLFEDRPKLEQIYEELEEGLRGYEKKLQKRGRESLALDVNRMGPQSGVLTSNAPMFGYTKDKGKKSEEDESEMAAALRKAMEENEDLQRRLETVQMENSSLGIQLNQVRNKEEGLQRALGEMKGKYDAVTRGKSPRREAENVNTSKVLKMGGRSVEDSFSVLNDLGNDMNWFRAKVNENVDYLMMIHVQAMALEDRIARGEELEGIGRQFEGSVSRKGDGGNGNFQKRGFSFTE